MDTEEITQEEGIESATSIEDALAEHLGEEQADDDYEDSEDDDADESATESDEDDGQKEELFTVVIDGVTKQVTKEELIANYQKGESSTARFTDAANMRREAQEQMAKAHQERANAIEVLRTYETQLQAFLAQPPDPALIDTNPAQYMRDKAAYENLQLQYAQAQQQRAQLEQQQFYELEQSQAVYLEEQSKELVKAIPEWSDNKVATKEKAEIKAYLKDKGYTEEALARVQDHREVVLVRKAMLYDRLIERHKSGSNKVKPQAPRVERPGNGGKNSKGEAAYKRLAKSGSIDDAARVFMNII